VQPSPAPPAEKRKPAGNTPFKRVDDSEIAFYDFDERLKNNSFNAMMNQAGGEQVGLNYQWGAKANEILSKVKGTSFRKEKDKKKKGTYMGGKIDCAVNSIKFQD
jgi:hypothetical protein